MAALSYWEKSRIHQFLHAIGSYVKSVSEGTGASVDNNDPQNPVVSARISTDPSNAITLGTDDGLYSDAGQVDSVTAGDGIDVDATDPASPIVSALLSADVGNALLFGTDFGLYVATSSGGQVDSVVAGDGISIDSTDPVNPVVATKLSTDTGNIATFGSDDGVFVNAGPALLIGGSGQDGDVDLDGVNTFSWATLAGSTYALTGSGRTPFINRLRISTGITLDPSQRALFVKQWDVTAGFYGTINTDGSNGTNATNAGIGSGGSNTSAGGIYFPATVGVVGTAGTFGVSSGNSTGSAATTANRFLNGGRGGRGGNGGAGSVGTPGTSAALSASTYLFGMGVSPYDQIGSYNTEVNNGDGGQSSSGGTGGTGDGTNLGGNGGGGAHGGRGVDLIVGEILTDASTPSNIVTARGGNGGDGFTKAVGNVGGGGGGGSGGGGAIRCVMGRLVGPPVAGFFNASGGNGGNGGNGVGTGANGNGGNGATGGVICYYNLASGTTANVVRPSGSAAAGTAGGTGGSCVVNLS